MRGLPALILLVFASSGGFAQAPDVPAPPEVKVPDAPGLYAVFDTSMGKIVAQLFPDKAPKTVANFVALAKGTKASATKTGAITKHPFYDGLTFHRVIKGFMIQTGDQTGKGNGNCGVPFLKDEVDPTVKFDKPGRLAMANQGRPNTAACQIFITVGAVQVDGAYTVFGQVVAGQETADTISKMPVMSDKPLRPIVVKTITIEERK